MQMLADGNPGAYIAPVGQLHQKETFKPLNHMPDDSDDDELVFYASFNITGYIEMFKGC